MKSKITLIAFVGIVLVAALVALNGAFNEMLAPDGIEPYVQVEDESHVTRYSFIPHHSFIRSATSWYDRVVERYTLEDGKFVLTSHIVYENHYPSIFSFSGSRLKVVEKVLK